MSSARSGDRISSLPEDILCSHILPRLPTKLAFAMSVLSKRWTPLCHSLPVLRFSDAGVQDLQSFLRSVDAIMLFPRAQHQPIKVFHFMCCSKLWFGKAFKIDGWVEAAKRLGVEDLQLFMIYDIILPPTIFSCRTLVVLRLKMLAVADNITFSAHLHLPSLKTLYLSEVYFQYLVDLKNLLSACPILEDLHTEKITCRSGSDIIVTPGGGFNTLSFKLVRAAINPFHIPFNKFLSVFGMEDRLPNSCYKVGLQVFPNLIRLELSFSVVFLGWDGVLEVLQHCPKLQILSIDKSKSISSSQNWEYPNPVPECLSYHLRTCTIRINYERLGDNLRFAEYVLQNARLLEQLRVTTISNTSSSNPMQKRQFSEELFSCPRTSPICKLIFI